MTQPLISVIVPVYKVEKYLNKCVESIVNQTYKNQEIILVDDGSPDNCPAMCDEWAKKDSRVKVIHKKNGGLSSARNAGLDIMTGSLVSFIDSDDYVGPEMHERLYNLMQEYDADMSICAGIDVFEDKPEPDIKGRPITIKLLSREEALRMLVCNRLTVIAPTKLYKSEIFDSIRFPEGVLYEDYATAHKTYGVCNKIILSNEIFYFYLKRDDSIVGRSAQNIFDKHKFQYTLFAFNERYNYFMGINRPDLAGLVTKCDNYTHALGLMERLNYWQFRKELSPFMRETIYRLIKTGKFSYWLRVGKLSLYWLRSLFRPYIKQENS